MKPVLSVIVPVYNGSKFVGKTLDRLLQETVEKEIIVINDGSTDNSFEILTGYAEKYDCIRVINQENKGVSVSRNVGIKEAKGEYVYFNDCDDLVAEGSLTRAISIFNDSIDAVIFSYQHVAADGSVIKSIKYLPSGIYNVKEWAYTPKQLINSHIISCMGTTVRKLSIIKENGIFFDEALSVYEDIIFAFQYMSHVCKLYFINEPLYSYVHINPNSLFIGYKKCQAQATHRMLASVETFFQIALGTDEVPYMRFFSQSTFLSAINNEAMLPFFSRTSHENLSCLSVSTYLEHLRNGRIRHIIYYWLLKNEKYTVLMILAGSFQKVRTLCWNLIVFAGRFLKYKILNFRK